MQRGVQVVVMETPAALEATERGGADGRVLVGAQDEQLGEIASVAGYRCCPPSRLDLVTGHV